MRNESDNFWIQIDGLYQCSSNQRIYVDSVFDKNTSEEHTPVFEEVTAKTKKGFMISQQHRFYFLALIKHSSVKKNIQNI